MAYIPFLHNAYFTAKVGIGTDNPVAKLELGTNDFLMVNTGTGGRAGILFNETGTPSATNVQYGARISYAESGDVLELVTRENNVDKLGIAIARQTGYVGIGTDGPLTPLHVLDDSSANVRAKIRIQGGATSGYGDLAVQSGYIRLIINDTDSTAYSASNQFNYINGSVATTLNSNGLGVGTTLPAFKLDVGGTFGVSNLPFNTDSVSVLVADETIGVEEVTNGSFTTDADWTKGTGWAIGGGTANGTSSVNPLYQTISGFTAGNVYKVRFEVTAVTSGYIRVYAYVGTNGTFTNIFNSTSLTTGVYESTFEFGGTNKILRFYGSVASTGGFTGSIDNVSVKQVTSASNQIQKRELGTGAFGPTPVGAFLPLAGGTMTGATLHGDSVHSYWGASNDLQIDHDGNHSVINNLTGHIYISNESDDGDIVFRSDNGSGGVTEYVRLDGGIKRTIFSQNAGFEDNVKAIFGSGNDLQIYHDGSDSYISDTGTGSLIIRSADNIKLETNTAELYFQGIKDGAVKLYYDNAEKLITTSTGVAIVGNITVDSALLSNQENTDIDTGAEVVAQVSTTYTAAFFDFVIKKTTNVRSGTVYACHDGTNVVFTETSTNDLGDTSDVTLSVDISGTNMRLLATVTSDDWSVKSLIRAI